MEKIRFIVKCTCGAVLFDKTEARYLAGNTELIIVQQHNCAAQQGVQSDGAWWCPSPCNRLHGADQDKCVVCGSPRR